MEIEERKNIIYSSKVDHAFRGYIYGLEWASSSKEIDPAKDIRLTSRFYSNNPLRLSFRS